MEVMGQTGFGKTKGLTEAYCDSSGGYGICIYMLYLTKLKQINPENLRQRL